MIIGLIAWAVLATAAGLHAYFKYSFLKEKYNRLLDGWRNGRPEDRSSK